jgi:hypothetical protein
MLQVKTTTSPKITFAKDNSDDDSFSDEERDSPGKGG